MATLADVGTLVETQSHSNSKITGSVNIVLNKTSEKGSESCSLSKCYSKEAAKDSPNSLATETKKDFENFGEGNTKPKEPSSNEEPAVCWEMFPPYFRNLFQTGVLTSFDPNVSFDKKPSWYDEDKFKKGQAFAMDYLLAVNYAEMLSFFLLFSVRSILEPLIFTDRTHTPYKAFKRYLSTYQRVMAWYRGNPFQEGSHSQQNVAAVRAMHHQVKTKLDSASTTEITMRTTLSGRCPMWTSVNPPFLDDFKSECSAPVPGTRLPANGGAWMNQCDMAITQISLVGLAVTYPEKFGIHNATEEEFESFLHLWRTYGYLLGIKDQYNFCDGDLKTVRERTQNFINLITKPSLRDSSTDWEHMCRCLYTGFSFALPVVSFEGALAHFCVILNIKSSCLNKRLSFLQSTLVRFADFTFNILCRIPWIRSLGNKLLLVAVDKAISTSPETLKSWKETEFPYMKKIEAGQPIL